MPGEKSANHVVAQRLAIIEALILEGHTTISQIWPYVRDWGRSKKSIWRYMKLTNDRLLQGISDDREKSLAKHLRSRYKERARIKKKGRKPKVDKDGVEVFGDDGKPIMIDCIDDRMILAIDQDIAKLEGIYEDVLNIKGGLVNKNAVVDIELTSEEGQRIAGELGLLIEKDKP